MVRPRFDYAVQASFPYLQKDIMLIERMQRLATRCVRVSEAYRIQNASKNSNSSQWSDTFSVLLSPRCTSCYTATWTCLRRSSLNRWLQVTSEGTISRSVNYVLTLPGGKRLLQFVRPDSGKDCLHTSLRLRQCPASRIAWMPTGAPFSLTLCDLIPLIVLMLMVFGAQVLLFRPKNWFDCIRKLIRRIELTSMVVTFERLDVNEIICRNAGTFAFVNGASLFLCYFDHYPPDF